MADAKTTALSAFTPVLTDIVYGVDDPGGTPASGKLTLQAILTLFQTNISITEAQISDLGAYITGITGEPLSDLSDVTITGIAAGEILKWNGSAWINNTLAEAGIAAASHTHTEADITDLGNYSLVGHTHSASAITDFNTEVDGRISAAVGVSVQAYSSELADLVFRWDPAAATTAASLIFLEATNNGAHFAILTAPAALAANATITLPGATGTLATLALAETLTNKTLTDPAITGAILEDIYTISDGAAFEIDPSNGTIQSITLGANRTPKATNFANGESLVLIVDDGSAYTITWTDATFGGSGVVWEGGSAPTLATSGVTKIALWKWNNQVYGKGIGDFA